MVRILVFLGVILCVSWPQKGPQKLVGHKKIFIGVDGVSREEFDHAKSLGLFRSLQHVHTHIAPFPSISDYSWNILVGARKVMGERGRIKTYEAAHFDRERNELVSDPREYFRRLGESHHYFTGAFEHWLNPYVESLLYVPTEELPRLELKQLLQAVKDDSDDLVTVMVASSDALAHTRADGHKFLQDLDQFILDIEEHYRKEKQDIEIILVSDHGQASRFSPGGSSVPLLPVKFNKVLERAQLRSVTKLHSSDEVVVPVMALANYGTVHFQDKSKAEALIRELQKENWFSLAAVRKEIKSGELKLVLTDASGSAELTIRKSNELKYFYQPVNGNPLKVSSEAQGKWLSDNEVRNLTPDNPDAFYRLAFTAFEEEAEFPDLIFTLKDEFYLAGDLDSFTTMFQTHGSLAKRSSSGILASTRPLKGHEELRTEEILSAAGLTPEMLFESTKRKSLPALEGHVATGSEEWDNRRVFALMNRAVQDSRYVFEGKSFDVVLEVVKPLLNHRSPQVPQTDWKNVVGPSDVAHLVDLMIRKGNVETVQKDPRFLQIKAKIARTTPSSDRSPSAEEKTFLTPEFVRRADAAKKVVMKSYSGLFFLERAFSIPEMPFVKDDRQLVKDADTSTTFAETFRERKLLQETWPFEFPLRWSPVTAPQDVTLVYVPGIYNSLFDDEIFRKGLDQLKHKWGARIISPTVFSTCSSAVNGKLLMESLKKDQAGQRRLGKDPRYFIVGYSKGGVDALHGFSEDTEFVSQYVAGLLTIASPIKGSSILNKSDLPIEVMQALGHEKSPAICLTEEKASKSITPASAQGFLRKNAPKLVGLTRYWSLSFASELKDSHLFMRATKSVARFGEPNDGVVALSASKFPEEYGATDLGVVDADHLAGILASHFPQEAFMESVLFTLGRLNAFDKKVGDETNELVSYQFKNTDPERHRVALNKRIGHFIKESFRTKKDLSHEMRKTLAETSYALKPFTLVQRKGKLHVSFQEGRWPTLVGGSSVPVESPEELRDLFLSSLQSSGKNLLKSSRLKIPESGRPLQSPPMNELGFHEDLRLNLRKLEGFISGKRVVPVSYFTHPEGFGFVYDHASSVDFRNEFQLSFEDSAPPEADDHPVSGWETLIDSSNKVWGKMSSANSSIRLTTYSWRFLAADYPELDLEIQVNDDVEGADVLYGGTGKDDSAFQLWFTFRIIDEKKNRDYMDPSDHMRTIGYYFGDEIAGKKLEMNHIYQNYFSEKDFVVAKLPAAKQKLIGIGKNMMGVPLVSHHNLLEDIRTSYPDVDPKQAEIVAITIQHDSNDTRGKSEALFRSLILRPRIQQTVKAD